MRDEAFERYSVYLLYWRTKVQILTQLAFERAIRHHMKKIVDEVVLFIVADVAAEGSFANFWVCVCVCVCVYAYVYI